MLNSLDTTKANGPDGVSARIQKSAAPNVAPVLVKLFNLSIRALPTTLETSSIVCIPKASKHQCPSYNQQISLLLVLSKMLERHFHTLVSTHLARNHPLSNFQWGFQSGKSTETALLATTNEWFTHLEARKDICAIFFDLHKAFNSVPHCAVMAKLHSLDLDPYILHWLCSYLTSREQKVVIEGASSGVQPVISGVPQGSVLGRYLLFLVYIDDEGELPHRLQANSVCRWWTALSTVWN